MFGPSWRGLRLEKGEKNQPVDDELRLVLSALETQQNGYNPAALRRLTDRNEKRVEE